MADCYITRRGGVGLNIKVLGNPQPENPKENTIWMDTDTPITAYSFSATEPENPVGGMAWILVGESSTAGFSVTKKNPVMVYPISAKQYVGDEWVDVGAKSFQNGMWVDWIPKGALYYKGNECENNGGKWVNKPWQFNSNGYTGVSCTAIEKTNNDITMTLVNAGAGKSTTLIKENLVDLTDYSTLTVKYVANGNKYVTFFVALPGTTYYGGGAAALGMNFSGVEEVATMDISELNGGYVIGVGVAQNSSGQTSVVTLKEVMLS